MSEFDKILHDRLNEEAEFPGLENNWQQLATRLATPPPPAGGAGAWGWLVPTSLLALLLLNGGFGAMLWRLHHENAELRERVADIQSRPSAAITAAPDTLRTSRVVMHTDTVWRTVYVMPRLREAAAPNEMSRLSFSEKMAPASGEAAPAAADFSEKTAAASTAQSVPTSGEAAPAAAGFSEKTAAASAAQSAPASREAAPAAAGFSEKTAAASAAQSAPTSGEAAPAAADFSEKTAAASAAQSAPTGNLAAAETAPKTSSQPDPSTAIAPTESAENQAVDTPPAAAEAAPKPADFDAAAGAQPIKKHRRSILRLTDFAIGANYTTGVPLVRDLSPWKGAGLMAEVKVAPQVRAKLLTDLTQLKYDGFNLDRRLNFPEAPELPGGGGPGPKERFDHITITQKRHQAGLRLEYLFPVERGLQPYLSAGYSWQRVATQDALFSHRDNHGDEITARVQTPPQVFSTNWAVGFGVEWQGKHFGAGTSAEFLTNTGKRTLNMPVIRAGVKYKF